MRAVTLNSVPETPALAEIPAPRPEAGEVLVKVTGSSVNGFDVAVAAGYLREMMEHRFPVVVGKDFAGTVAALGEGVDGFVVGQPVFGVVMRPFLGPGTMAEYVTVPAGYGIAPIPDGLSAEAAGALGLAGTTALNGLDALAPADGETVLISGATGGVGALAVQLAAARGARVIATARPGAEADFVTGLTGAEVDLVDYTGDVPAQVRAIAPRGVDAALHLAGDLGELAGLLRAGGRLATTLGPAPADAPGDGITVHSILADPNPRTLTELATRAASGALRVPVTSSYPMEKASDAFAAFGAGTLGKIAITCV